MEQSNYWRIANAKPDPIKGVFQQLSELRTLIHDGLRNTNMDESDSEALCQTLTLITEAYHAIGAERVNGDGDYLYSRVDYDDEPF